MLNLPKLADSTYSGVGVKVAHRDEQQLKFAFRGRIIANTTEDLSKRVVALCSREGWRPEIVFDFQQVGQIDSIGIGAICDIHGYVAENGGKMRIENGSPSVLKVLRLMSMDSIIDLG